MNVSKLNECFYIRWMFLYQVNVGWLEPICDELKRNPKQILQPFIDGIDAMSLLYDAPDIYHIGAFSWDLRWAPYL